MPVAARFMAGSKAQRGRRGENLDQVGGSSGELTIFDCVVKCFAVPSVQTCGGGGDRDGGGGGGQGSRSVSSLVLEKSVSGPSTDKDQKTVWTGRTERHTHPAHSFPSSLWWCWKKED